MKTTIISLFLFLTFNLNAQVQMTRKQINQKTDSILKKGNLLFKFGKSEIISFDLAMTKENIKQDFVRFSINLIGDTIKEYLGECLIYQVGDSIKTIILDIENNYCIYEYTFINDFNKPYYESIIKRKLTEFEDKLLKINNIIKKEVLNKKYEVVLPEHLKFIDILIPLKKGYEYYLINPHFSGNNGEFIDNYKFTFDEKGVIISYNKNHSFGITTKLEEIQKGRKTRQIYKYLSIKSFISEDDICKFKLLGNLYGVNEFSVYSYEQSTFFIYDLKKDRIKINKN